MGSVSSLVSNVLSNSTPAILTNLTTQAVRAVEQNRSNRQAQGQLAAQQQQALADATIKANDQRDKLVTENARIEADRQNQLRAAVSKIRAQYSSQGIDPDSGSAAVLQQARADDVATADNQDDQDLQSNLTSINNQLGSLQQRNLLTQTQLQQRQQLKYWYD